MSCCEAILPDTGEKSSMKRDELHINIKTSRVTLKADIHSAFSSLEMDRHSRRRTGFEH
jgi:hypothetical protein